MNSEKKGERSCQNLICDTVPGICRSGLR